MRGLAIAILVLLPNLALLQPASASSFSACTKRCKGDAYHRSKRCAIIDRQARSCRGGSCSNIRRDHRRCVRRASNQQRACERSCGRLRRAAARKRRARRSKARAEGLALRRAIIAQRREAKRQRRYALAASVALALVIGVGGMAVVAHHLTTSRPRPGSRRRRFYS